MFSRCYLLSLEWSLRFVNRMRGLSDIYINTELYVNKVTIYIHEMEINVHFNLNIHFSYSFRNFFFLRLKKITCIRLVRQINMLFSVKSTCKIYNGMNIIENNRECKFKILIYLTGKTFSTLSKDSKTNINIYIKILKEKKIRIAIKYTELKSWHV